LIASQPGVAAVGEIGAATGLFVAPEGAACLPALRKLVADNAIAEGDTVVIFNTGSGIKYLEAFGG
jgi:threonine synthase